MFGGEAWGEVHVSQNRGQWGMRGFKFVTFYHSLPYVQGDRCELRVVALGIARE